MFTKNSQKTVNIFQVRAVNKSVLNIDLHKIHNMDNF